MRQAVEYLAVELEKIGAEEVLGYDTAEALLRHFERVSGALLLNGERVVEAFSHPVARLLEAIDAGDAERVDPSVGVHFG